MSLFFELSFRPSKNLDEQEKGKKKKEKTVSLTLHRDNLQIATEISRVEPRDREAVAVASCAFCFVFEVFLILRKSESLLLLFRPPLAFLALFFSPSSSPRSLSNSPSTAGPSSPSPSFSMSSSGLLAVEYRYVQILGSPERGMPPPSSETFNVMSSSPSATTSLTGGASAPLSSLSKRSLTARREFLTSSKSMWWRWEGT